MLLAQLAQSKGMKVDPKSDRPSADQLPTITNYPPLAMVLRPSWRRSLLLLLVCAGFFAVGVLMIREGKPEAWFAAVVCGVFTLTALVLILPGAAYLRLAPEGFTICSLYRKSFIRWADVRDFRIVIIGHNKMVGFDYAPHDQPAKRSRRFAAAITGAEGALPNAYGLKADQLALLMNIFWVRATGTLQ